MSCDREQISRLVDGQLAAAELDQVLAGMDEAEAREAWQVYHLVGDTLRSRELSTLACHEDLAARLRGKLGPQDQTVTPVPVDVRAEAANDHSFRWKLVAGAASFAAVAAVSWGLMGNPAGSTGDTGNGAVLAMNTPSARGSVEQVTPMVDASLRSDTAGADDSMGGDPELDRLLAAHRQMAGEAAFGRMAGFIRSATYEGPAR